MKAVICTKYGPPEVLEMGEVEKPVPNDDEILIKIAATAVNSGDTRVRGLAVEGFKPVNSTFEEAASIIFGGQSALYFLGKAGIERKKEKSVLIIGATGSVGSAAIQIAKHHQANVTAVCSTAGKPLMENLGVAQVIYYAVGKTTKKQCRPLLKKGGAYQTVGGMDVASENVEQLRILKSLFEKGELKAVIDKTYPLHEMVEAHRYVDT